MARREVIEVVCDRCKRTDNQLKDAVPNTGGEPELVIILHGKKTVYTDLCRSCRETVTNYHGSITKDRKKAEPTEKDATPAPKEGEPAVSTAVKHGIFGGRKAG